MKVLLVRPEAPNMLNFTKILDNEPLELEYLHTVLMGLGHTDYIFDGLVEQRTFQEVLKAEKPDVVAITGYITQENVMKRYAALAKLWEPKTVTIIGGVHAQLNFERFYGHEVDYILRSESVAVFGDLIEGLQNQALKPEYLNGLAYKESGKWTVNPLVAICINELPIPDRSHFNQHKAHYRYLDLEQVATVKTAFSCPHTCNFCYCTQLASGVYQMRSLDLVIEEIKGLTTDNVQIVDDDFLVNPERVWDFVEQLKREKIDKTFICYARADDVVRNPELVEALAQCGFKYFLVGLEAVSDIQLKNLNKKTSEDINRRCVEIIEATSAQCIGLMIVSHEATVSDFEELYSWVSTHGLKFVTVSIFTPIPGTPLYEAYKDQLITTNIEDWDFLHLVIKPTQMSQAAFYRQYYKLFMKLYRLAKKTGIYSFMDLKYYKNLIGSYLKRKIKAEFGALNKTNSIK